MAVQSFSSVPARVFGLRETQPAAALLTGRPHDSGREAASSESGASQFSMSALPGPFVLGGGLPLLPAPFTHPGAMLPPPFLSSGPSDQGTTRYIGRCLMPWVVHSSVDGIALRINLRIWSQAGVGFGC